MNSEEQQFLNDLDKRLWNAADRLRSNVTPSDYMHVVLGLVFLKYISDAFKERRTELEAAFKDPANDYYLGDDASVDKVANSFHAWKRGEAVDEPGYAKAATLADIRQHEYVLTPGRYVGAAAQEDDEPFGDKMARLSATLGEQFAESAKLEAQIRKNLAGLGYAL